MMTRTQKFFFLTLSFFMHLINPSVSQATAWPASTGVEVTGDLVMLLPTFETSGIVWQQRFNQLITVSDEGDVCSLNVDGTNVTCDYPGHYDLEAVTVADDATDLVYLGLENPDSILEFDLSTGTLTGKSWDLTTWMVSADANLGLEALTFVPNGDHPYADSSSGGLFYAGLQLDGTIHIFDLDLSLSGRVTQVDVITPVSGRADIADLFYSTDTQVLYASYDSANRLDEMTTSGVILNEYTFPGDDQEGITLVSSCPDVSATLYVAEDSGPAVGPEIWAYENYPADCPLVDFDGDGVDSSLDCNDFDVTVSALQTYYRDADGDGLGSAISLSACLSLAPVGYVTNSSDVNDSDFDNDGVVTSTDCNDADASISVLQTYYLDADHDGLGGDTSQILCSNTAPSGYVTNSDDTNDSGITASLIEIGNDGIDNDGDGIIDEVNTLAENGYHTTYSSLDRTSSSVYRASVLSVAGSTNGAILVTYADHSVYSYTIFSMTTTKKTKVRSPTTGTLSVTSYNSRYSATVNAYTGGII